ncbi:MAG: UDP-N-acetylmuramoyl-tripeptide--D-alanyl-D-alanine ligase [Desulfobacterales bacterium]|nr:UDP-N-acetylmuramoyl-tripeptide--D-alanyl-D-alanine ligase [Desulfobacterales bacterium]
MTEPIPWKTGDIIQAADARLLHGDPNRSFAGISIDSRRIRAEDFFVAIKGEIHDGCEFADQVVGQGVRGVMVNESAAGDLPLNRWAESGVAVAAVKDTTRALGDLAAFHRGRSGASIAAITGSIGKTTTRRMIVSVLSRRFRVLSAEGNLNNEFGLPLTLLRLEKGHEWGVVELGMNHAGEIARLTEISAPDVGVITNIAPAHLEGVGDLEGVMKAKGELVDGLGPGDVAMLNADNAMVMRIAGRARIPVILFGESETASTRAESIVQKDLRVAFRLRLPESTIDVVLNTPGKFMVSNALAAAAVGARLGLSPGEIKAGLEAVPPMKGRMNLLKTDSGVNVIDDTYNANPGSMAAALQTLVRVKGESRGIFVAGDMFELGSHAEALHREVGELAGRSGLSRLYIAGAHARPMAEGAEKAGLAPEHIFIGGREEILKDLLPRLAPGDWVLVKGSRGMKMEKVVKGLAGGEG